MDTETIKPSKYERFKIETKPAPHVFQIPNKFDVSARKVRLAATLVHEVCPGIPAHYDGETL